jgi:hypothetical protein
MSYPISNFSPVPNCPETPFYTYFLLLRCHLFRLFLSSSSIFSPDVERETGMEHISAMICLILALTVTLHAERSFRVCFASAQCDQPQGNMSQDVPVFFVPMCGARELIGISAVDVSLPFLEWLRPLSL